MYAIKTAESVITYVYTEDGQISVEGNVDNSTIKVTGTPANEAWGEFNEAVAAINQRFVQAANDESRMAIYDEYNELVAATIEQNSDNIFGVVLLVENGTEYTSQQFLEKLDALSEQMQSLDMVVEAKAKVERRMRTEPAVEGSDIVPLYIDIEQPDVNGNPVSLKSVVETKGNKYVLLDFWASWCGPCMGEMPHLTKAYNKYHKLGFEIFGVSFDRNEDAWKNAIKNIGMKWVNVSEINSFKTAAAEEYVVESIPTNFLIDCSTGIIIAKNLRGEEVEQKLAELLK